MWLRGISTLSQTGVSTRLQEVRLPDRTAKVYFDFTFASVFLPLSCRRSLLNIRRSFNNRQLELTCTSSFCNLNRTSRSASILRDDFESVALAISPSISRFTSIRVSDRSLKYSWVFSTLSNGVAGRYSNVGTFRDNRKSVFSAAHRFKKHTTNPALPRAGWLQVSSGTNQL